MVHLRFPLPHSFFVHYSNQVGRHGTNRVLMANLQLACQLGHGEDLLRKADPT